MRRQQPDPCDRAVQTDRCAAHPDGSRSAIAVRRGLALLLLMAAGATPVVAGKPLAAVGPSSLAHLRARERAALERLGARVLPSRGAWLQRSTTDCGVAVTREVLRMYADGPLPSHDDVARRAGTTLSGTTLSGIAHALAVSGVATLREDGGHALAGGEPYVAHLNIGHFVLVRRVVGEAVWLFDPLVGEIEISTRGFRGLWSGAGLRIVGQAGLEQGRGRTSAPAE